MLGDTRKVTVFAQRTKAQFTAEANEGLAPMGNFSPDVDAGHGLRVWAL